jgi:hypothetical protein
MGVMTETSPADVLDALARDIQLRVFLRDGRIDAMPAKHSRRRQLLAEVAQVFEPGVRYPEHRVNDMLGALYPDYAALRRYLVDEDFLDRAGGEYWRIGGPVAS